ncbi:MAG: flagellar hook-associated protein FlgK [Planctomycetota bacterium]|jgi:flagellar hook-associated protein 1 FlgK
MSLVSALHTGRTGLAANQLALEVTGNNLANAATEGYSRQNAIAVAAPGIEVQQGIRVGTGVRIEAIKRQVDEALNTRLRAAIGDQSAAAAGQNILTQIESIHNELTDQGLLSRLDRFFNTWSELANNPTENGLRSLVIAEGQSLSSFFQSVRSDLVDLRRQTDDALGAAVVEAESLLNRIAMVNEEIVVAEGGLGGANALHDQRDKLLAELAEYFEITTVEDNSGTMSVYVDSIPVVQGNDSRGLKLVRETNPGGEVEISLRIKEDNSLLEPSTGTIGQIATSRERDVNFAIDTLDEMAGQLIYELNKLHSSGQAENGFDDVLSAYSVDDAAAALNSTTANLDFTPVNGSFELHVTQKSTGTRESSLIQVDLDGLNGDDTTLTGLAAAISATPNLSATVTVDGRLEITADSSDFEFSFASDSSGVLAALGVNTFFTGTDASDIRVNQRLVDDPTLLAVARDHLLGDNGTAEAIARLGDQPVDALGGLTIVEYWTRHVEDYAVRTDQANESLEAQRIIAQGLEAQRQAVSGVSVDEESINLLAFQRAYQGSARFITVVDEVMQTLLGLVR